MAEKKLTYEEARQRLLAIVQQLEEGGLPLEESLTLWKEGDALAKFCQKFLADAEKELVQTSGSDIS
jgi:exodeoxyribonuclease VII small subunit